MRRVIIIGLDGADWHFIDKGLSKGILPSFEEIISNGASGILESQPPLTAPAWTTITTGKEIRNHGLAGFSWRDYDYNVRLISARDKKAKDIWEYVDKAIVINVPITYPVKKINGVIIGGMLSPTLNEKSVYPPTEIKVLKDYGYVIEPESSPRAIKESLDIRIEVAKHYFRRDWRLFFIVFRELDHMQHYFWDRSFPLYKKIDSFIGWLLDHMDSKTNLFVISDHGFNKIDRVFVVENWLREMGYLKLIDDDNEKVNSIFDAAISKLYPMLSSLKSLADRLGVSNLPPVKNVMNYFQSKKGGRNIIDFSRTTVVYGYWGELFINSKGRYRRGFVYPKDVPKIRKKVKNDLLSFTDEKGIRVIDYVKTKDDLGARYVRKVPDVLFFVNSEQGYSGTPYFRYTNKVILSARTLRKEGEHTKNAIFIAYGPNIRKGSRLNKGRRLVDFAPTVLKLLGCGEVISGLGGDVMYEAILS